MLKKALTKALSRSWWFIMSVVLANAISQFSSAHRVSLWGLLVSLVGALVVFMLVVVPVEFQKLQNDR